MSECFSKNVFVTSESYHKKKSSATIILFVCFIQIYLYDFNKFSELALLLSIVLV